MSVRDHGDPRGFARRWLQSVEEEDMHAVCHVTYVRETWVHGRCRLTIDHDLRAKPFPDPRQLQAHAPTPLLPPEWVILELKFNGAEPGWMRNLVQRLRLISEPVPVSPTSSCSSAVMRLAGDAAGMGGVGG